MDAGNLAVDVILGDEKRAAETIVNAVTGRPVSGSAVADAVVTIASDALMLVPGLGAAAAAAKAGRVARTASKGAKAAAKAKSAATEVNSLKAARAAQKKGYAIRFSPRDAKNLAKQEARRASAQKKVNKAAVKLGMTENPTEARFARIGKDAMAKKKAMKAKFNSPRRKKMRRTGNTVSFTKDVLDFGRAYDNNNTEE